MSFFTLKRQDLTTHVIARGFIWALGRGRVLANATALLYQKPLKKDEEISTSNHKFNSFHILMNMKDFENVSKNALIHENT